MTTIKFSNAVVAPATTSVVVPFGGAPAVGDLVVVWLAVDNQIHIVNPGYNSTNQWFPMSEVRLPIKHQLRAFYHTWNASDSGNSATFTLVPSPALTPADDNILTANAVAVAVVLTGPVGLKEQFPSETLDQVQASINTVATKNAVSSMFTAVYTPSLVTVSTADPSDSVVRTATGAAQVLTLFKVNSPGLGYQTVITPTAQSAMAVHQASFNDNPTFIYHPPVLQEGPVQEDILFFRYKLTRGYTVINQGGPFSAHRWLTTDQLAAATQVFVGSQTITSTDRTNLLNSGVGGDFRSA